MDYKVFMEKITEYYDNLNSDVEFIITSQHEWIQTYMVRPRGKCYYYNKLEARGELRELKEIFFPDEDIIIKEIQREDNNGDRIRLHVEKNNINRITMQNFY